MKRDSYQQIEWRERAGTLPPRDENQARGEEAKAHGPANLIHQRVCWRRDLMGNYDLEVEE
jgi:hypothetical protein